MHLLKHASQRAVKFPQWHQFSRQTTVLEPRSQLPVLVKSFHRDPGAVGLQTGKIIHPTDDPFSRARLPYLESGPPRHVKSSIIDLVKKWEHVLFDA